MPYVQVQPEALVVGNEYALTRKGMESRTEGANWEVVNKPQYNGAPPTMPMKKVSVWKTPATVVAPPTAERALMDGYRALQTWKSKDAEDAWKTRSYAYGKKPKYTTIAPMEIRKKAYFAGVNAQGSLVFTQERSFGSTKPVAFVPVDVNEKAKSSWGSMAPKYNNVVSPNDWAFWSESRNNGTRRNNTNNSNAGLNRLSQMTALKAQHAPNSNAYKALAAEEQNLIMKHLGGKRNSRTKRNSRSNRKNRTY
jgi:hypothetical protein